MRTNKTLNQYNDELRTTFACIQAARSWIEYAASVRANETKALNEAYAILRKAPLKVRRIEKVLHNIVYLLGQNNTTTQIRFVSTQLFFIGLQCRNELMAKKRRLNHL